MREEKRKAWLASIKVQTRERMLIERDFYREMRRAAITFQVRPPSRRRRHDATCRSVCRPWGHVPGPRCRRRRTANTRGRFVSEGSCLRNLSVTKL